MNDEQRSTRDQGRQGNGVITGSLIVAALAVAAIVAFVLQNTENVAIEWLFFSGDWALWLVIVITIVLTLIAERLVTFALRHRRRQ